MLKRDDKDGIIEFLKSQLERIAKTQVDPSQRYQPQQSTIYKNCVCPDCGEEFEESVDVPDDQDAFSYIHEDVVLNMKDIAEKAIAEASF